MRSPKTVLVLATMNRGKAREIRKALIGLPVKVITLADAGIRTSYPEKGVSFKENAEGKSRFYSGKSTHSTPRAEARGMLRVDTERRFLPRFKNRGLAPSNVSRYLTLAEDSGLEIEALAGAPGIFSARFSGRRPTDEKNNQKVLRLMKNTPPAERRARFVCCMVLAMNGRTMKTVSGRVRGEIAFDKKGELGFGYDPIFFYRPLRKTFGELRPAEKNVVSHRGRALKKMKTFLREYLRPA